MSTTSRLMSALGAAALIGSAIAAVPSGAGAGGPAYRITAGVEVIEVVVVGGRGGNAGSFLFQEGGVGCQVTASLTVATGDSVTWLLGRPGQDTTFATNEQPGGVGGAGARPGGFGGATEQTFSNSATPGPGGGGASSLSLNGAEQIIAAGGAGGSATTGGGSACYANTPVGSDGFGTVPTAGGAFTPTAGGVGGLSNGGSSTPPPGTAGQSSTGSPPGAGGTGGPGRFGGNGGGGGGGGISGGGGGAGQNSFNGTSNTGGAGLSGAPDAPTGVAPAQFGGGPRSTGLILIREVDIDTATLPGGTTGTAYSATLDATLTEYSDSAIVVSASVAALTDDVVWSLADGSAPLPSGLTLAGDGTLSGTPTATGTTTVTLSAEVLDDSGNVRARTVADFDIVVSDGPTPTTEPTPTSTTEAAPSTTVPGGSGTLPATGAGGVAPLVAAGLALAGSGVGLGWVARRRRS